MRKIIPYILAIFALSSYGGVQQSGNWSSSATWDTGTVEGTSSDSPLGVLEFDSDNLTLDVDVNAWASTINASTINKATVNIDEGKTLYIASTKDADVTLAGSENSYMEFNGLGNVEINSSNPGERFMEYGTWVFNTDVKLVQFGLRDSKGGTITFNKDVVSNGQLSIGNKWIVNINADYNGSTTLNVWGDTTVLNIATGSNVSAGTLLMVSGSIDGNIIVSSRNGSDTSSDCFNFTLGRRNQTTGTIEVGENASIISTNSSGYSMIRNVNITFNSKEASVFTASKLYIGGQSGNGLTTSITLNSSDIFCSRGQSSQSVSIINVGTFIDAGIKSADVSLILNASQNFGGFEFENGSYMNLTLNGNTLNVGKFSSVDSGQKYVYVEIEDLVNFTFKISEIGDLNILYDEDDNMMTNSITFKDENLAGYSNTYLVEAEDGGYWVNSSLAIPEPALMSALFGLVAAAVVLRKNSRRR